MKYIIIGIVIFIVLWLIKTISRSITIAKNMQSLDGVDMQTKYAELISCLQQKRKNLSLEEKGLFSFVLHNAVGDIPPSDWYKIVHKQGKTHIEYVRYDYFKGIVTLELRWDFDDNVTQKDMATKIEYDINVNIGKQFLFGQI